MLKPHKGTLQQWHRYGLKGTEDYIILGYFSGHPEFHSRYGHTSKVIKEEGTEIETLNSRYTLGEPDLKKRI